MTARRRITAEVKGADAAIEVAGILDELAGAVSAFEIREADALWRVEAYPRASRQRIDDEWAYYGTETMFKKAGFKKVRGVLPVPKGWTPRVTMRSSG